MSDRHGRRRPRAVDSNPPQESSRHRYMTRSVTRDENIRSFFQTYWTNPRRTNTSRSTVMSPPPPVSQSMRNYLRQRRLSLRRSAIEIARDRDTSSRTAQEIPSSSALPRTRRETSRAVRDSTANRLRSGSSTNAQPTNDSGNSRVNLRIRSYAAMSTGGRANIYPRPPARHLEANAHRDSAPRITASIRLHRRGQARANSVSQSENGTQPNQRRTRRRLFEKLQESISQRTNNLYSILDLQERQRQRLSRAASANDDEFPAVMRSLELVRSNRWDEETNNYPFMHFLEETIISDPRPTAPSARLRRANWANSSRVAARAQQSSRERRRQRALTNLGDLLASVRNMTSASRAERVRRVERRRSRNAPNRTTNDRVVYFDALDDNIRFAFDAVEANELIDPTLSVSAVGDPDATTFINSMYGDLSTDDVFYSESERVESDSDGSVESASTATPHSLVSLSLNALHPSPTPSLSSTETDVNVEDEGEATNDDDEASLERSPVITSRYTEEAGGNPIIFLHNNISVHLLSSMAELADAFTNFRESLLSISETHNPQEVFRGFASPQYSNLEPTQRRVPEGVDCQRAKLIDELNSNTAECIICTDPIRSEEQVWPCNNCFNIFHLPCIRRWAKTNRDTEMGGAWICPVCRRPKFCSPNRLRYRCLCGRLAKPKPIPGVTPHCCGEQCKHNCGLLCHPGPCKMTEAETAAMIKAASSSRQQVPGSETTPLQSEPSAVTVEGSNEDVTTMSTDEIQALTKMLDAEVKIMKNMRNQLHQEMLSYNVKFKENRGKIKVNKVRPYLVANVVEIIDEEVVNRTEEEEEDDDFGEKKVVIKTSMRQVFCLPMAGLVDIDDLKPGDLVAVNKDSFLILEQLPIELDPRIKAMEVEEKPTDSYTDIGGLDLQIKELVEAVVLPMTQKEKFEKLGIIPPKGVIMYGPPGTGKTLLARACAAQTNSTFLKLAGPQLVQMFIGDGAKLVRDAFTLARLKAPTIIFIDEIDAIGTKRFDSNKAGDREVQRTMLELLNQLDGFTPTTNIKVLAATNRIDTLDPALLRSGRLDRKIEFPFPDEEARVRILHIHSRKMKLSHDVNCEEIARSTDGFNGAQLKAVCVEAGMCALRRDSNLVTHEDFLDAVVEVQAKKKYSLDHYS